MPPTTRRILAEPSLRLTVLSEGRSLDQAIHWIHSSDLEDPTPFLDRGQMLLTTGTQFRDDATQSDYDAYVSRLVERGIVAVGFGTEVIRSGTPTELIDACANGGLTLVEVPYRTPFIAMIRWAADVLAKESRERDDWSLGAQRAISPAALGQGGLAGVLEALARQLECRVATFEPDGTFDAAVSPDAFSVPELHALSAEAIRLLRAGNRSASAITIDGQSVSLQTLGPRGQLGGVLAIVGAKNHDAAAQAVMTSAVALAEISLEQSRIRRGSLMPVHEGFFSLLLAGQAEVVVRALPGLPPGEIRVVLCRSESQQSHWFIEAVERRAWTRASRMFFAPHDGDLVVLVSESEWPAFRTFLDDHEVSAGVSGSTRLERVAVGLAQARHALAHSARAGSAVTEFSSVGDSTFLGLLSEPEMVELASTRLSPLLADSRGRERLACASVWLAHNGAWDSAAKELGLHRHSLKSRVDQVGVALGLSLDDFADRVQLWSMLAAVEFGAGGGSS
jgi:purine catabolism regulator